MIGLINQIEAPKIIRLPLPRHHLSGLGNVAKAVRDVRTGLCSRPPVVRLAFGSGPIEKPWRSHRAFDVTFLPVRASTAYRQLRLDQTQISHADVSTSRHDQVVVDGNIQEASRCHHLSCRSNIIRAGLKNAGGMVVNQDHTAG